MKKLLVSTALAGTLLAAPAYATLQICVSEVGVAGSQQCSATSNTGALTFSPTTEPQMGSITISTTGVPVEVNPDLATTNISATTLGTFTGPLTLDVQVFQTNLPSSTDNLESTFTVNGLITVPGSPLPGPSTLSDFTGGTGTSLGNPLHSATFGQVATGTAQQGPTLVGGITSDAQQFLVTFNTGGETITDTIQTIGVASAVPEPSTLALIGSALMLFGFWWKRRNGNA